MITQVGAFYYIHFSFCVPRPRLDVLLCWMYLDALLCRMLQSDRYYIHQSMVMHGSPSPNLDAVVMAYAFCDMPWLCNLTISWSIVFAPVPLKRKRSTDESATDASYHTNNTFWAAMNKLKVPRWYARSFLAMIALSPASGFTKSLDEVSDDEGDSPKVCPTLEMTAPEHGVYRREERQWSKDELLSGSGRVAVNVPGGGGVSSWRPRCRCSSRTA